MFYEKIDLYDYFHLSRGGFAGGTLTVYCRRQYGDLTKKRRPAILIVPGGGYQMLSAREGEPVALRFLYEGYACFVLDYSLKTSYPAPLTEAAMAMAYIRKNAEKYSVDPEKVCAVGFSAGGHLVGMLATMSDDHVLSERLGEDAALARPDAVLLTYPVATACAHTHSDTMQTISGGDEALRERLGIDARVTKSSSPAFIWHTYEDNCVPVFGALSLASAYERAGVPFELHIFEKGWHGLSVASVETEAEDATVRQVEHVAVWQDLALVWLKKRGFEVKNV